MGQGLFLCGYGCEPWIWDGIIEGFTHKGKAIEWPKRELKDFHKIEDFASWLRDEEKEVEFIVGHSLGGLVAMYYARMFPKSVKKIILIESFIKTPEKFFQNLTMKEDDIHNELIDMMRREGGFYSNELRDGLRELDLSQIIKEVKCPIYLVYGDRGNRDHEEVIKKLGLNNEVLNKVQIMIIEDACHFPMLENYESMKIILKDIL